MSKVTTDKVDDSKETVLDESGFSIVSGTFKAAQLALTEYSINNRVLRVSLTKDEAVEQKCKDFELNKLNQGGTAVDKMQKTEGGPDKPATKGTNATRGKRVYKSKSTDNKSSTTFRQFVKKAKSEGDKSVRQQETRLRSVNGSREPFSILKSPPNGAKKTEPNKTTTIASAEDKVRYVLECPPEIPMEPRRLNYKFSKLAVDVRSLRLPAPNWKIKIYMKNKAISAIAFTNKQEQERVLKFSSNSDVYELIIDNKKACLLGSPVTIDNGQDVEVLLDIIHNISPQDPMIEYL